MGVMRRKTADPPKAAFSPRARHERRNASRRRQIRLRYILLGARWEAPLSPPPERSIHRAVRATRRPSRNSRAGCNPVPYAARTISPCGAKSAREKSGQKRKSDKTNPNPNCGTNPPIQLKLNGSPRIEKTEPRLLARP